MSYRITYGASIIKDQILHKKRKAKNKAYFIILIILVLISVVYKNKIYRYLLPGDPQITEKALHEFVADIQEGESVGDAVTAFCRQIIDNA